MSAGLREGRRREFSRFPEFASPALRDAIPDPNDVSTFEASRLDRHGTDHPEIGLLYERLLHLRHQEIIPRLGEAPPAGAIYSVDGARLVVRWQWADGGGLELIANLSMGGAQLPPLSAGWRTIWGEDGVFGDDMLPWAVVWRIGGGKR